MSPADEGTEAYESIMRTLTYFQDNIDLKYIYCIRDTGDGTFTFGLDPTVEDPGEFGSPIVRTEALEKASKGTPSADEVHYEDAWGSFYSAYSPVYDSKDEVAGDPPHEREGLARAGSGGDEDTLPGTAHDHVHLRVVWVEAHRHAPPPWLPTPSRQSYQRASRSNAVAALPCYGVMVLGMLCRTIFARF